MRIRSILGALVIASLPAMPALAVDMTPEDIKRMVDEAVNKRIQEHERHESSAERVMEKKEGQAGAVQYPVATGPITDIRVGRKGEENVPLGFGSTGSGKLIYAKPFLSAPKATVGGYADVMYNNLSRQNLDNPSRNTFGQQRMVPVRCRSSLRKIALCPRRHLRWRLCSAPPKSSPQRSEKA